MKVAIITTTRQRYHQYLCAEIAKSNELVAVFNPLSKPPKTGRIQHHRDNIAKYGFIQHVLQKLARRHVGWNLDQDVATAEDRLIPNAEADFQKHVAPLVRDVADINSAEGIALIREINPDLVLCSGGPIYRKPLIEACGTMLNFHTGISPLYNGAWTVFWTYANRQPHLTGGTVMRMSPVVDGGDILAHYLPSVEAEDTPGSLFIKTLIGGAKLYNEVIDDLAADRPLIALPQGKAFHYYYGYEWTVSQTIAIARHVRNRICKKHVRPEIIARYWNASDEAEGRSRLEQTLLKLVYNG